MVADLIDTMHREKGRLNSANLAVEHALSSAALLRFVHCGIRRGDYCVCVFKLVGTYDGSHTGRHNSLASPQLIRFPKGRVEAVCDNHCRLWGPYVIKKNQEFISSHAGRAVTYPENAPDALGNVDEQLISNAVTQGVVDLFELVEIDKDDRISRMTAVAQTHAMGKAFPEQGTVWQTGQFVLECSPRQFVRDDVKFSSPVRDLAFDVRVRCFQLFTEEVDTRGDRVNDVPAGADLGASIESKNCELLDSGRYLFQTLFNVVNLRVVTVWHRARVSRYCCIRGSRRRSVF